jgi:hypothetical protein
VVNAKFLFKIQSVQVRMMNFSKRIFDFQCVKYACRGVKNIAGNSTVHLKRNQCHGLLSKDPIHVNFEIDVIKCRKLLI